MSHGVLESIRRFLKNDDGPTAIEYAVMLGVIVIFCLAVLFNLGEVQNGIWQESGEALSGMGGGD
ncbi:MAG: Flp family type IVb pilin [Mariniblastus sp.]|nr:Flp family type IVb pilin [Mariniblastus sp.]